MPQDALICEHCGWRREAQALVPGSVLNGKYLVGGSLGQGGFGITYIAWDISCNEKLAIKEYFPISYATRDQQNHYTVKPRPDCNLEFSTGRAGFSTEADNLQKFQSDDNIVRLKGRFSGNNTEYIAMEFINGATLETYLKKLGRAMLLEDAVAILAPIAAALDRIHAQGLVHRDISPDNIMISESGTVKILDFGAARKPNVSGGSISIILKIHYAPPEQFGTKGIQGSWTDVYAFAATIYDLITRRPPLGTYLIPSKLRNLQGYTLPPLSSFGIPITPAQENIIMKGLAIERSERYQTVKEFYDDLKAATNKESLLIKCPADHFFDVKKHDKCPYCHPIVATSDQSKKNPILYGVTALSAAAALFFGIQYSSVINDRNIAYSLIDDYNLLGYDKVKSRLGYGSDKYYAGIPILFIKTGDSGGTIPLYGKFNGRPSVSEPTKTLAVKFGKWKNHWIDLTVKSAKTGAYTLHFTNDANKDAFDVLVVVK